MKIVRKWIELKSNYGHLSVLQYFDSILFMKAILSQFLHKKDAFLYRICLYSDLKKT